MTRLLRILQSLLPALVVALLTACASDFQRPEDWAPPVSATRTTCQELDGRYDNNGESAYPYAQISDRALSVRLLHFMPPERNASVHLRMVGDSATKARLEVTVLSATGSVLRSEVLRRDDAGIEQQGTFECADGVLWLPAKVTVMKDGTGGGRNSTRLGLIPAQDGTLVGVQRSAGVGLIGWVIPLVQTQDIWFRWPIAGGPGPGVGPSR